MNARDRGPRNGCFSAMPNRRRMFFWSLWLGLLMIGAARCSEGEPDPDYPCWIGVRSLHASGISVEDTSDVRMVFNAYVAYVDSSGGAYDDGTTDWVFDRAAYARPFAGLDYWRVWYWMSHPGYDEPIVAKHLFVDENGVVVRALGCI